MAGCIAVYSQKIESTDEYTEDGESYYYNSIVDRVNTLTFIYGDVDIGGIPTYVWFRVDYVETVTITRLINGSLETETYTLNGSGYTAFCGGSADSLGTSSCGNHTWSGSENALFARLQAMNGTVVLGTETIVFTTSGQRWCFDDDDENPRPVPFPPPGGGGGGGGSDDCRDDLSANAGDSCRSILQAAYDAVRIIANKLGTDFNDRFDT